MIISASRRTDIPCYYSDWLAERVKAGRVLTRNPMNRSQIREVSLLPSDVDCFVFWTKDPANMLGKLPLLDERGYAYYFQFTLTPYGRDVEPGLRGKADIADTFAGLAASVGNSRVLWRYDPVILNGLFDFAYHAREFERLCEKLHPHTKSVTVSFVDSYAKLRTDSIKEISHAEMTELAGMFARVAGRYGLAVKTCCEKIDLSALGIQHAACVDKILIESLLGRPLNVKPDKNQRPDCGCCASVDIGVYNTCPNGCVYCYANHSAASIAKNAARHRADGELMIP